MRIGIHDAHARTVRRLLVWGTALSLIGATAHAAPTSAPDRAVRDGARLKDADTALKRVFPGTTAIREQTLLPLDSGGTSLMGLIVRLFGERPDGEFEGISTKRFVYHAMSNDQKIGLAHGSSVQVEGATIDVFIYYAPDGTVREVQVEGLPEPIFASLRDGKYLDQFRGHSPEDFEVTIGKKGRIKARGSFYNEVRRPGGVARTAFEKIFRAVRYNAAFMDVAYFITQHPDLADEQKISPIQVTSGPEAFVKNRATPSPTIPPGSPFETRPLLQGAQGAANAAQLPPANSVPVQSKE